MSSRKPDSEGCSYGHSAEWIYRRSSDGWRCCRLCRRVASNKHIKKRNLQEKQSGYRPSKDYLVARGLRYQARMLLVTADELERTELLRFHIVTLTARLFGITREQAFAKGGTERVIAARMVMMYLIKESTKLTMATIGKIFRLERTTGLHACDRLAARMAKNPDFAKTVENILKQAYQLAGVAQGGTKASILATFESQGRDANGGANGHSTSQI
jgi:hypothetical protein